MRGGVGHPRFSRRAEPGGPANAVAPPPRRAWRRGHTRKSPKPLRPRPPRPRRGIKLPMPRRTRSSIGTRPQDVPPFRPTGPAPPRGSGPQFWRLPTAAKIVCLHVRAQWTDRQRHFYSRSEKTRLRQTASPSAGWRGVPLSF
jgi:hypothetical protein